MKVDCPHCGASYTIDDRRVPSAGLKVKCSKCAGVFPVKRPEPAAPEAEVAAPPASIPLPPPESPFAFPPPPAPPEPPAASIPLPPPESPFAFPPPPAPAASIPPPESPFAAGPAAPFPPPAEPPSPFAAAPSAGTALGFGEIDFDMGEPAAPAPPIPPFPPPAAGPVPPIPPFPPAAPVPDPFAPGPIQATVPPAAGGDDLEDLFGEAKAPPPVAAPPAAPAPVLQGSAGAEGTWQVRRRSGKVFGPFPAEDVAEMLAKGELQGNEDVSPDRGATWQPMSAVAVFRDAAGKANAAPPTAAPAFTGRMAAGKVTAEGEAAPPRPRWLRLAVAGAAVAAVLGVGVAGSFTRYGFFFLRAFRSDAERARIAGLVARSEAELARGEYGAEKEALRIAGEALAAAPDDAGTRLGYVAAASALERRHAGTTDATKRAADAARALGEDAAGSPEAAAAELALAIARGDAQALPAREAAVEQALAKGKAPAEPLALLVRAALVRGDAARAGAQLKRLEALQRGSGRALLASGALALRQGKADDARAAFEKALEKEPKSAEARIELAALASSAGDLDRAGTLLAPLLDPAAAAALAPLDRARALTAGAALAARHAADAAKADALLVRAVEADGAFVPARVALAIHRLARGDAAGAVSATDPLVADAPKAPDLAEARIRALLGAGRALDAANLAEAALAANPGNPALLGAKAAVQEQTGKQAEAAATWRDAIARAPADWRPRLGLARLALAGKDLAVAQEQVAAAVERGATAPAPQAVLGDLKAAQGDSAGAEAAYRKALALDEEHAPALIGLARIAMARGDLAAARGSVDRALAVDPGRPEAHMIDGDLHWKAGELEPAEGAYQAAAELAPRSALAFARLGAVKLERVDAGGAQRALETATGLDAQVAEAQFWLGRALLAKGELPGALTRLRRAIELDPAAPHHLWLGIALERTNALPEAIDAYRAAAAADPKLPEPQERIGNLYAAAGRCDQAVPAFEKAIAAAPGTPRLRIAVADCRERQGKHADAIRIYREVLKADPKSAAVPYRLARALHESAGVRDAIPWYERATRDEPENPMPYYYLGFVYKDRGQKARAVQAFRTYLSKRPDAEDKKDIEQEIEDLGG